jgi:hypothetical protein
MMEVNWDGYLEWSDSSNITAQLPAYNNFNWLPLGDFVLGIFFFFFFNMSAQEGEGDSN